MTAAARCSKWWVDPWMRVGTPTRTRVGRILLLLAALAATVLPAMIAYYGADGWLWPLTASVLICGPVGVVLADVLAEAFDRPARDPLALASSPIPADRKLGTALRLLVLMLGLLFGIFLGYAVMFVVPVLPEDQMALLAKDYGRTVRILVGVAIVLAAAGSLTWYRTEAFRLQSAVDRARFDVLKQQMHPHFLFNSLNSLKQLIVEDPLGAEDAAQRISDLYRMLLEVSKHTTVPLKDEVSIVENYLAIERIRYGDRLTVYVSIDQDVEDRHVPSLMLQTLAENAVKHGIAKDRQGGEVRVGATRRDDGWVEVTVSNTGAPFAPAATGSHVPTGLANTVGRLELMYGKASAFTIAADPVLGTVVRFAVSGKRVEE